MTAEGMVRSELEPPQGFAGLAELVSDIGIDLRAAVVAAGEGMADEWPDDIDDERWATNFLHGRAPRKAPAAAVLQGIVGFFVFILRMPYGWVILVGGAISLFSMCESGSRKSSSPTSYASSYSSSTGAAPSPAVRSTSAVPYTPPVEDYSENRPQVGRNLRLSTAEVRYCVFEDTRISKMEPLVLNNAQVAAFNRFVEDYNSRCGSFQYTRGTLESVRKQATERDAQLSAEARARLRSGRKRAGAVEGRTE
ncbi:MULTISPECIES: hypothetical protein [Anaeromyxobacter]|uniref:hypothetical protein n=1 Tax=Anaeromyxobacter TaxID=161492 RepID=UPI001F57E32C|nr:MULTISPECIES: hypothetical protein [unclassified Anaeromyxobacter]